MGMPRMGIATRMTFIGTLCYDALFAFYAFDEPMNAACFAAYVSKMLICHLSSPGILSSWTM